MKVVAAKCPSCGAQIDVDKDSNCTKCEYCGSQVMVEEAIQKYQIEVSGKIEVNNLPLLENYLRIGEMHYNDGEYEEAYNQYSKACDLDPSNYIAILRKGLSKACLNNCEGFEINYAFNGIKNAYKIMRQKDLDNTEINKYISECNSTIMKIENRMEDYYSKNLMLKEEVEEFVSKLLLCIEAEEYLYSIIENNEGLRYLIICNMVGIILYVLEPKKFRTGQAYGPNASTYLYILDKNKKDELLQKKKKYMLEKEVLEPTTGSENPIKFKDAQIHKSGVFAQILCYIMVAFSGLIATLSIFINPLICFVWTANTIIYIPPIKTTILNSHENMSGLILVLRITLPILGFILLGSIPTK